MTAKYEAKNRGKNRYVMATDMTATSPKRDKGPMSISTSKSASLWKSN